MPIADRITVGNPASFSAIESQITNGPPLSSTNAVAYNGKMWIVGGVSTVQNLTIKTYTDVVSTQFQNVLYYFKQAKQYQLSIAEDARAHFNTPGANFDTEKISEINTGYQTNYDAYIAAFADAQLQYELHKANGDETSDFTYQTTHTLAVSSDGYTWTRVDQNPFALVSYQINAPQTLEHTSQVNGLAWNGSLWLAIGDGGGTANQTTVLNTVISPISGIASNYNATNQLATSPDGVTWTVRGRPGRMFSGLAGAPYGGGQPYGVAASSSLFMVVCGNLSGIHNYNTGYNTIYDPFYDDVCTICKSTDGINWSKVGNSGDFITEQGKWTGYDAVGGLFQGYSVAYNGAYWVAVGAGLPDPGSSYTNVLTGTLRSCIVVSSDNGATWTQGLDNYVGPDPNNASLKNYYNVFSVAWNGSYWLAVGQIANDSHYIPSNFGQTGGKYYYAGDNKGVIITSTDSLDWSVTTGFPVFTTVAWDGNYWIASGQIGIDYNDGNKPIGVTQRSRDGVNWLTLSLSGNAIATKIPLPILGGVVNTVSSLIVGFGTPMSILRSFDDVTWYPQLTDGYGNNFSGSIQKEFRGVVWTGSSWIVVGKPQYGRYGQSILRSPDGLTWTYPANTLEDGRGIAWNGTTAIAVGGGTDTHILTSTDLSSWILRTPDSLQECNCVAWNGTMWIIGGKGGINYSIDGESGSKADGETWARANKCSLDTVYGVAWNGFNWLACGYGTTTTILFSTDGMHWYDVKSDPFDSDCNQVAWNGAMWVAVGRSINTIATSIDGYNWVGQGNSIFSKEGRTISWNGTLWIATGSGTGSFQIASSPDGTTWTPFTIQLTRGDCYANKTITLPYTVYTPSDETIGLVDAAVAIIQGLTDADVAAEEAALIAFQDAELAAAEAAASLAARNATKASADIYRTRLLYWQSTIVQQYTPLLNTTIVDLRNYSNTIRSLFLDVEGVYNTVNENVLIMGSYYNNIYDDKNTQVSIDATLNLLLDLCTGIESKLVKFYNTLGYLYTQLIVSTLDVRDISGTRNMIENWGFPTTTKNVALTAYDDGVTAYNSEYATATTTFNTSVTTITYTDPSSSNAPDFSGALTALETAANTVVVMNKIFNFALPYKQNADALYAQAIDNVNGWATITNTTPNTAAVTAAFAPYYKSYFYSPSYETEDNPPPTAPTIYILNVGEQFGVASYGDSNVIIQHTINRPAIGLKYFNVIASDFSHPGAYASTLTTLYTQMKDSFDTVNALKTSAINYARGLRTGAIKNKLDDFLDITGKKFQSSNEFEVDTLINEILSTTVYSNSSYETSTRLALIAKAGSLLYPSIPDPLYPTDRSKDTPQLFALLRAVYMADADAEADGCLPPLRGWGSASNGVSLSELGTQGISGWAKYNNTYWTRNKLSAFIGANTSSGSSAVYNASSTDPSTFLGNYYTLYNKALLWADFLTFTKDATYQTMTDDYNAFKAALLAFQTDLKFAQATADAALVSDLAAIESQYVPIATENIQSLANSVSEQIPSEGDMTLFGYLPFVSGTVTGVYLTNYGSKYTNTPTVSFIGGGGTGAAATAVINTGVLGITLLSGGSGYINAPTVNITTIESNGTNAAALATISDGHVNGIAMTVNGSGYYQSDIEVTFTDNGMTDAVGHAVIRDGRLINIDLARFGSGYTSTPTVNIIGGNGTGATAVATISDQQITDIRITNPGFGYTSKPLITFTYGSRTSAVAVCTVPRIVSNIQVTNGGSGYTTAPSVSITPVNANSGSGALAIANVSIPSSGSTFADVVATLDTDFGSLTSLKNADMSTYTHSQLKAAITSAKALVTTINTIQGSARYKQIITGISVYKTVRANAEAYKTLLETRYNRWINLKSQAFNKRIFSIGDKSTGKGSDSIMSIPPSNVIYWAPVKYSIFNNLDTQQYEQCYYNVGNSTIMALPKFNTTGPAGIYRGSAMYFSEVTFSSSMLPVTGKINFSTSDFETDGNLFLSNTSGFADGGRIDLTAVLLSSFASPLTIKGYLRIYSTVSTLNYAILQINSGETVANGVKLVCTSIDYEGTISTADPVYVMFSSDLSTFANIYFKPEYPTYSSSLKYTKGARVKNISGDIYQCILDNTSTITTGIVGQSPSLFPDKWKRRKYPYVIYNEEKVEASPENLTYLKRKDLIRYDVNSKYSQGDYVYHPSDDTYYYYCINDVESLKYITQINPTNQNYWTKRTYATGYVKGIYVELNPSNFPILDPTSVPEYSPNVTYSNQSYVSYKGGVFYINAPSDFTQQGKAPPGLYNGWYLNITRAPVYSNSVVYNNLDYVLYNGNIFRLNIASQATQTGLPPPTSNSGWILNDTKAPLYSDSETYTNLDYVLYNGSIYKSTATQTGNIPTNSGWTLTTTWVLAYSNTTTYNNQDYVLYGGCVFQANLKAGTTQTGNAPPLINGWSYDTTWVPSFSATSVYKNQDYVLYNGRVFQLNIPVGNTITKLAPPTASNNWVPDFTKVPAYSVTGLYQREDYVTYDGSIYFLNVPVGIMSQGQTPGAVGSPWVVTTRTVAYVNSSYSFVEITDANFPPLDPVNFSSYQNTFDRPLTSIVSGAVYTSQFITETVPKTYVKNKFVSYNDGTNTCVYECIYSSENLIGVDVSNSYYWKKVQYPMVFYKGEFIEAFPGNIPPYGYTTDYPKSNERPLSDSAEFETYSDINVYNIGALVSFSANDQITEPTLTAILQDLGYTGSLGGLGLNALIAILKEFVPGYFERLSTTAFYECVDDTIRIVPIQNIPLSNETYWNQIDYPYINTDLDGTIVADPATGNFNAASDFDYHEYDNNWIYRVGDLTSYNGKIYECTNTTPPLVNETVTGVSPLTSTGYWKDISYSGADYDNFVAPAYADNNIIPWTAFGGASYAKGALILWDGDIYKCETAVTYQSSYNLYIPADVAALKASVPNLNPTVWRKIVDYTTLPLPISNNYNPSSPYIVGDIVTIKTLSDPLSTAALNASSFYGLDAYNTLTFYRCISTDPSHPVKYTYDEFYTLNEYTTAADGTDVYKLGIAYGNYKDYNLPRYIEADDDPFQLDGFLVELRRKVILFVELPYKYAKTHVEAARRGDIVNVTTVINGATQVKYNYGSLAVKPQGAESEFDTLQSEIATIISNFDLSETSDGINPANCDIDTVFASVYFMVTLQLKQWRSDMIHYVSQVNKMKTQYFNLPSVQANIFKDPYKYLNPVALATTTTSPGQVKVMFRDLGIGDIDEITYNLDVLHNGILSSEAEREYYNRNIIILSSYINTINGHIQAAQNLIGFSLITAASRSNTKCGVRINCIVSNVDNVSPIAIDTPITDYNGVDNYTEQRNFNDRVVNNYNILGIITFEELQSLTAYNAENDAYYIRNFTIDYDSLSTQDKQKYMDTDRHLYLYKTDATRNVVGWEQGGWIDQGRFDDPGDSLTLTGLVNSMMASALVPPNYTLPTSRESSLALQLTYESANPGMRGLTVLANGLTGTLAASFQSVWDPMNYIGLYDAITGTPMLGASGVSFANFNDRMESINLVNQLISIERKKIKSRQNGVLRYGIESGNTTSFILGVGGMKRGITYNFGLFDAGGARQSGLSVEYIDRAVFVVKFINSTTISSGEISFSNGIAASGTVAISKLSASYSDVSTLLSTFYSSSATIKGYITIYSALNPDLNYSIFSITSGSSVGTGSTSGINLVCTFIKSSGTLVVDSSVGVAFSKSLPSENILYGSQITVVGSNTIVIPASSGSGTGTVVGIKVTTGTKSDGQYTLKYKLSTDQDRDYLSLTPNLAYDATHGNGWSMLRYAATIALPTQNISDESGLHTDQEISDAIYIIGDLLLLCVKNIDNLNEAVKEVPKMVRSVDTSTYDLPPVTDPPIGARPPDYTPPTYKAPTLQLRESIQSTIDKLRLERKELKLVLKNLKAERAAIRGLPIEIKVVNVDIPKATFDIQKPLAPAATQAPPRPITQKMYEDGISQHRSKFPSDSAGLRRKLTEFEESKAKYKAWEAKQSAQIPPKAMENIAPVQNNIEAVEAAKLKRATLEIEAKQAYLDAKKLNTQRISEKTISIDQARTDISKLTNELDDALLEETRIQIENSVKTSEFAAAEATYRTNVDAADKALANRTRAQAEYDSLKSDYAKTTNLRDAAIVKARLEFAQSKLGTAIGEEVTANGQLKISYESYQAELVKTPAIKNGIKSQLSQLFQFIVEFTFEDLFDATKSLVRSALGRALRSIVAGIVASHIFHNTLIEFKGRIGNAKVESALVKRFTAMAKAVGLPLAKAASAAGQGTIGRRILRAPIIGVLGAIGEIYGTFMTASANGAYESGPLVLNY